MELQETNRNENSGDLKSVSNCQYSLHDKWKPSSVDAYVLGLSVNGAENQVVASLSDHTIQILDVAFSSLRATVVLTGHKDTITEAKFSPKSDETIFTSSKDGSILAWDLRSKGSQKPVLTFKDTTSEELKPLNCFDIDPHGNFVCGGTDLVGSDAFLLFWDIRNTKVLGGYWESHTDDITDVTYHSDKKNLMVSGSVDGLINVFDVSETSEEDALKNTLNTESSVSKLNWIGNNRLACVTHIEEMQLWDAENLNLIKTYKRECLDSLIKTKVDYFVDTISMPDKKDLKLVTGATDGLCHIWSLENNDTSLWTTLENGHSEVIRCLSVLGDRFLSGGEDGTICLWKQNVPERYNSKSKSHHKQNVSSHNKKPYF